MRCSPIVALLAIALSTVSGESSAQTCGGEGQGPCGFTDCQPNLVLTAGKCKHPDCGRDAQRPCRIDERFAKSCDAGLIELHPDLLADLTVQGVSIEPLMKSAALFVTAWRKGAQPKAAPIPAFRTVPEKVPTKTLPSAPPNVFKR